MADDTCPTPPPSCPRYPSLDLWRGIACLMVVVNHSAFRQPLPARGDPTVLGWVEYGIGEVAHRLWIGVPIFFVISGYCIAATADSSRRKSVGYWSFAVRRVRRIFPPYLICLGVTAALVAAFELVWPGSIMATRMIYRPWWFSGSQWFGNITLTELWRYHFFGSPKALFLGHAWTLNYEEQFYAVMGLLLLVSRRGLFVGAMVVTIACPVVTLVCSRNSIPIDGFFFDGAWTLFACGVLVYYALNYASPPQRAAAAIALAVAVTYAARDPGRLLDAEKSYEQQLFVATAFALVALLGRRADKGLTSQGWLRPLFACGTMCYSLYLVHLPVTIFLNAAVRPCGVDPHRVSPLITVPVGIVSSVAVAYVFYRYVERRFLNAPEPKADNLAANPLSERILASDTHNPRSPDSFGKAAVDPH
jgi:peptidoglycan/LPS O-acetylase OafA/YrhL